jgi:ATP-dependent RNA helicase RhlE
LTDFRDLKLSEKSLQALARAGFEQPTPIQAQAIPPALAGRDVIGTAATGTGKTAAFLLPIIERLAGTTGTRALVLAPTRELALQIGEELERFGKARHVRGAVVIGGVGMGQQAQAFRDRREVIVATPGRLVDHLQGGTARLDQVEVLVLDEADRMLDMGFRPQLTRILQRLPRPRQTLLFSATMGAEVAEFAAAHLTDPVRVEVARSGTTAARAEQRVFLCSQEEKLALLLALLADDDLSTLVFTRTRRRADRVAKGVGRAGHKVARIHADRSQGQRRQALDGFKDGSYRVLVATDIAARGIDVAEIGHVVNFDLPHVAEDYVHRVGRTARMEASGQASAFCAPEEAALLRAIEKLTRASLPRAEVPRQGEVFRAEASRASEGRAHQGLPPHRRPGAARPGHASAGPRGSRAGAASPR